MGVWNWLKSRGWWRSKRNSPAIFALYHEAHHVYHGRPTSLGSALVVFSTHDQARSYAFCHGLRGFLPAAMNPDTIVERFDEFASEGYLSFLLDLGLDGQYVGLYPFGEPRVRHLRRLLAQTLRLAARSRRFSARMARRRGGMSEAKREFFLAMDAYKRLRFTEAIGRFARAAVLDSLVAAKAHTELGEIFRLQRKLSDAQDHYLAAMKIYGPETSADAARALAGLGHCYFHTGDAESAIDAFRDAWLRAPDEPEYGLLLARMLNQTGRTKDAGTVLEQLRDDHPADVEVLDEMAQWLARSDSLAAAHLVRRKINRLKPDDAENLLKLAELCGALGKVSEGIEIFTRAMARKPEAHVELRFYIYCIRQGVRALRSGQPDSAALCFRTIIRAHSACPTAHLGLALALESLDRQSAVITIDDDGVSIPINADVAAEAARARSMAESLGISAAATIFDVTEEALLADFRQTLRKSELADELESLLYDDTDDAPPDDSD